MMRSAIDDMSGTISTGPAALAPRMYAANMSNGIQTGTVISATNQASTRIIMVTPTTTMAGGAMAITAGIRADTKKPG
ncbi:hypothetical protein ATO7_02505 [Oceanococcus atlanticus]|uniref:Uncharacterized protein n=1 Tax=Oceanococcus atlanticus TaxID=1317117 RepID=A0A1Y1SH45_9GAMM|nr:hypothetical protein [Oceanococcus atlanticus]ORE88710.1 hypothetical protein ATO7_02505 [Oceanococcus atlanticus]